MQRCCNLLHLHLSWCVHVCVHAIRCMLPHKSNNITPPSTHPHHTSRIPGKSHGNYPEKLKPYLRMCFPFSESKWKRIDRCSCDAWLALTQLATSCVWQLHGRHTLFQRLRSCKFHFYVLTCMLHHCFMRFHSRSVVILPLSACYHLLRVWYLQLLQVLYVCCAALWHFEHVVSRSTVCEW